VTSAPLTQITKRKKHNTVRRKKHNEEEKHNTIRRNDRTKYTETNID